MVTLPVFFETGIGVKNEKAIPASEKPFFFCNTSIAPADHTKDAADLGEGLVDRGKVWLLSRRFISRGGAGVGQYWFNRKDSAVVPVARAATATAYAAGLRHSR